jgi:phage terminase Nu1 subunit (DNA packaging protein)
MNPWIHPDQKALAAALGVTTRILTGWAKTGAPIHTSGPHDELAVRLWYAAHADKKAKPITPATGDLLPYADQLADLRTGSGKRPADTPSDSLKRAQRSRVELLNAEKRQELLKQAQNHVAQVVGRVEQELKGNLLTPGTIGQIHGFCREPLTEAERHLIPLLRGRITAAIATGLASGQSVIEGHG